jgi:acyl-CoA reductase-like NAD-dependent aldehyde dehydrogenase
VMTPAPLLVRDHLFIGGEMVKPESTDVIEVISPVTEQRIGTALFAHASRRSLSSSPRRWAHRSASRIASKHRFP